MTAVVRPGPPALEPDQYPGGVVIHVYGIPSCTLVRVTRARTAAECAARVADAVVAALELHGDRAVCLVAYDGDTGHRYPAAAWA